MQPTGFLPELQTTRAQNISGIGEGPLLLASGTLSNSALHALNRHGLHILRVFSRPCRDGESSRCFVFKPALHRARAIRRLIAG